MPSPELAGHLHGYSDYWERTGGFSTRRELPHAEGVLIVNLGEPIAITGGDGRVLHLNAGEAFAPARIFAPRSPVRTARRRACTSSCRSRACGGCSAFPMDRLVDQVVPLEAVLGAETRDLGAKLCEANDADRRVALLEAALAARLAAARPLDRQQAYGLHLLRRRPERDIAEIARDLGWSRKHFADRVKDAVGIGPRCFRRLLRFQKI